MTSTEASLLSFLIFLIVGLLTYFIMPKKMKWIVLLVLSIAMTFMLTAYWIIFVFAIVTICYVSGLFIQKINDEYKIKKDGLEKEERKALKAKYNKKCRIITLISVLLIVSFLVVLKYLHLPLGSLNNFFDKYYFLKIYFAILGISYYSLIGISYLIDIQRGKYEAQKNYFKLYLFIGFFPTMIEGPFSRYDELSPQLFKQTNPNYSDVAEGLHLIVWGLFKKIFIADRAYIFVGNLLGDWGTYKSYYNLFGLVLYVFELYADFSGYIDIARGVSRVFGIKLTKNFDSPLMSKSVSEFWRRWHISLGSWLKDYIFYPIALSAPVRKISSKVHGKISPAIEKVIINVIPLFFVWLICGIWHGAGIKFIVYGMYFYVIIILEMLFEPLKLKIFKKDNWFVSVLLIIKTFIIVCFGLALFRAPNLSNYFNFIQHLFSNKGAKVNWNGVMSLYDLRLLLLGIGIMIFVDIFSYFKPNFKLSNCKLYIRYAVLIIMLLLVIFMGAYGPDYAEVAPMYALY